MRELPLARPPDMRATRLAGRAACSVPDGVLRGGFYQR